MSLFLVDIGCPITFIHIPKTGGTSIRQGRELSTYHLYDPENFWPSPALAVVRDPYDRIESCWRDFRFIRPQLGLDFETFVTTMQTDWPVDLINNPASVAHHAAPMTHPLHGLQHADCIINYSNLQEGFDEFCESVGVEPYTLPHHRNAGNHPRAPRTPELEGIVRKIYKDDYDFLEKL